MNHLIDNLYPFSYYVGILSCQPSTKYVANIFFTYSLLRKCKTLAQHHQQKSQSAQPHIPIHIYSFALHKTQHHDGQEGLDEAQAFYIQSTLGLLNYLVVGTSV
jgi:hypothetical protein